VRNCSVQCRQAVVQQGSVSAVARGGRCAPSLPKRWWSGEMRKCEGGSLLRNGLPPCVAACPPRGAVPSSRWQKREVEVQKISQECAEAVQGVGEVW